MIGGSFTTFCLIFWLINPGHPPTAKKLLQNPLQFEPRDGQGDVTVKTFVRQKTYIIKHHWLRLYYAPTMGSAVHG